MMIKFKKILAIALLAIIISCKQKEQKTTSTSWVINTKEELQKSIVETNNIVIKDGKVKPSSKTATFKTVFNF